jgi:hypothetical protein
MEIRQYQVLVEKCKKVELMKRGRPDKNGGGGPMRSQVDVKILNDCSFTFKFWSLFIRSCVD